MKSREYYISLILSHAEELKSNFGVKSLRLFGSVSRNEQKEGSDVDICVDMEPKMFLVVRLKRFLENLLECSVDIVRIHKRINPYLLKEIEHDGIYIIKQNSRYLMSQAFVTILHMVILILTEILYQTLSKIILTSCWLPLIILSQNSLFKYENFRLFRKFEKSKIMLGIPPFAITILLKRLDYSILFCIFASKLYRLMNSRILIASTI